MRFNIVKIRKWLNANKIFFEVIVATLLSFMAVFVSIQTNKIAETQTQIMIEENMPQIEIRMGQQYNELSKFYDNDIWYFYNRGGKLSNFEISYYSFYEFIYRPNFDTIVIPIYGYLNMQGVLTGEGDGLIYQIDNNHNGKKEIELRDSLWDFGFNNVTVFARLEFKDILNRQHEEYYQISPGITSVDKIKWDNVKSKFEDSNFRFDYSHLNAKLIIKKILVKDSLLL